ncbi:MAG: response regulator transcription factor [Lachnospiraceae bacterium]|jgi:DNA-binding response OmpR family regulator|nr:response regulator transcription factor [Lachnospiraceae bacterium]MDD7701528.1 response regulator transcription factor [Lachnospiraceae bacterium]MDY3300870.1 response regulator transcription factor [Lachnospiraceae bacterium]
MTSKILICDDNEEIRNILRILLTSEGYAVTEAENGSDLLELIDDSFDLLILDIMMPGLNGFQVCEEVRKNYLMPILFLTAKSSDSDKSLGLLIGGDDYLVKPFSHAELTGRVKSLLRRYQIYKGKEAKVGNQFYETDYLRVNKEINEVFRTTDGVRLDLSDKEYQILRLLVSTPGRVFPAQLIYETIWEEPYLYSSNATIMVHIRNLRLKIEDDPKNPHHILTSWGKGYQYV